MIEHMLGGAAGVLDLLAQPGRGAGHFDLDTYARAVVEARDAVAEITRGPSVHLNAACSGGIIAAGLLGHLAACDELGGGRASPCSSARSTTSARGRRPRS